MLERINSRACAAPLLLCCLLLICASSSTAQETNDAPAPSIGCVHIFDSYGDVYYEDEQARLDNFAIELMHDPTLKGYIVFYHGVNELPARLNDLRPDRAVDYLINMRGIDAARISVIKGGFRAEQTTELWPVPESAPAPEPSDTVEYIKPSGRTYQYDEQILDPEFIHNLSNDSEDESEAETEADATEAAESEAVVEQATSSDASDDEVEVEPVAEKIVPASEDTDASLYWVSEKYAEAVKQEEDARAYIIYYADSEQINMTEMQAIIERGKSILIDKYGLKADCLVVTYGGYRSSPTVDTWVVLANDSLPAPTPEQRPIEEPAVDDDDDAQ